MREPILRYVELKTGHGDNGPAWIARVVPSRSGRTLYFNGRALKRETGGGIAGNHVDLESGDEYWVSDVKKNGHDRHWAGGGVVLIEQSAVPEYLLLTGASSLQERRLKVVPDFPLAHPRDFERLEHKGIAVCLMTGTTISRKDSGSIETRLATPADARAIAELHTASWVESLGMEPSFPFEERFARWNTRLSDPTVHCLIAENDRELIGFADAEVTLSCAELTNVYVCPSARRRGIALALLRRVTALGGMRTWRLWVDEDSVAIALYHRLGFRASGRSRPDNRGTGSRVLLEFIRTEPK